MFYILMYLNKQTLYMKCKSRYFLNISYKLLIIYKSKIKELNIISYRLNDKQL
jgi:hypothetical protein